MLLFDWLRGMRKKYLLRQSHESFEVTDDSFSDVLKRVLSRLDPFLAYY